MEIDDKEIEKLGEMARIKLSDEEKKALTGDVEAILGYVSELKTVSSDLDRDVSGDTDTLINVMREDENPHAEGLYTEKILNEAPQRERDYLKVKKIL